jgi:hypothetical protein
MTELTPQQQAEQSYKASLDSVALLQAGKPDDMTDSEWADCKQRNIDHLKIQLEKGADFYGDHDLAPFTQAINN